MGSDFMRGTLTYARAVPLGGGGERWLKIHLANLMGKDKLSFDDRVRYVDSNIGEAVAAGRDPLSSAAGAFWLKADSPFQALAVCRELADLSQVPAHARELYESRVPVHQDGSCNGLQHYAALGRDEAGARAVNLVFDEADDKPSDVYSRVLALVLDKIEADARLPVEPATPQGDRVSVVRKDSSIFARAQGGLVWTTGGGALVSAPVGADGSAQRVDLEEHTRPMRKLCALFLKGYVDRKVVKQTVMTSVYGVTFIGAREQVWNRLHERLGDATTINLGPGGAPVPLTPDERDYMLGLASQYLARATLTSLGDLFTSAQAIMRWLGDMARAVSSRGQPVSWTSPLGMPILQPYRIRKKHVVVLGGAASRAAAGGSQVDVTITANEEHNPVSKSRQRTAFPPNFIHSLDSSHMLMTASACNRAGITFAAVHDSFWSHAAHVDPMRDLLRDQFVDLYSRPVLEDFRDSVAARFPDLRLPELPARGTLDLNAVRGAKYFFS
jgi:DNA-directed RNA polymerase